MRHTLSISQKQYDMLLGHLLQNKDEQAAYLICGLSRTDSEARLLVREVIPVRPEHLRGQSERHLSIEAPSFLRAMKLADELNACFVFVHSHPPDVPEHSSQDDREEPGLFRTAYNRIKTANAVHASLVLTTAAGPVGRVWLDSGDAKPLDLVRVYGPRFRFYFRNGVDHGMDTTFHDRQVRAFGPDLQPLLKALTIGVVGAGGTGSAVIEQLVRLGIGRIVVADGGLLEKSNVSRVYGSSVNDEGVAKVDLAHRLVDAIGLGTEVVKVAKPITFKSAMQALRDCDVIFNCTDDQWGRALLCCFCLEYLIPAFDLGVRIDSQDGLIRSIQGRITLIQTGTPCLFCRGRITEDRVSAESMQALDPFEAERLRAEGYAPELPDTDPAVITFTTEVAATAVSEFLHKLTGFKGPDHEISEILHRFDATAINTPGARARENCFCTAEDRFGRGDQTRFLGTNWRPE